MNDMIIHIATDFYPRPAGRFSADGEYTGYDSKGISTQETYEAICELVSSYEHLCVAVNNFINKRISNQNMINCFF